MASTPYLYAGQSLTPAMIEELILELFQGKLAHRRQIVDIVAKTHLARGGKRAAAKDMPRSVKKALSNLQSRELAYNPSHGNWQIRSTAPSSAAPNTAMPAPDGVTAAPEPTVPDDAIGGTVYVYYLPAYRTASVAKGEDRWPCKIGYTTGDPLLRVLSQAATALPENPHLALVVATGEPAALEDAIHAVLSARRRKLETSPGSEWYATSPTEVIEILRFIDPALAASAEVNADPT